MWCKKPQSKMHELGFAWELTSRSLNGPERGGLLRIDVILPNEPKRLPKQKARTCGDLIKFLASIIIRVSGVQVPLPLPYFSDIVDQKVGGFWLACHLPAVWPCLS
mgnify:CR=1 FL=1